MTDPPLPDPLLEEREKCGRRVSGAEQGSQPQRGVLVVELGFVCTSRAS